MLKLDSIFRIWIYNYTYDRNLYTACNNMYKTWGYVWPDIARTNIYIYIYHVKILWYTDFAPCNSDNIASQHIPKVVFHQQAPEKHWFIATQTTWYQLTPTHIISHWFTLMRINSHYQTVTHTSSHNLTWNKYSSHEFTSHHIEKDPL